MSLSNLGGVLLSNNPCYMPQVFRVLGLNFSEQLFSLILVIIVKVVSILLILSFNQSFLRKLVST